MRFLLLLLTFFLTMPLHAETVDIDNAELQRLLKEGVKLIDIRTQPEWEQTGIVPGSQLLTFFDLQGRADAAGWLAHLKQSVKPEEPVILICRTGNRTRAVSRFLTEQAGFAKVYNVRQGIVAWMRNGGAVLPATSAIASCKSTKTC